MKNADQLEALFYKAFSKIADYVVRCNILQNPLEALFYKAFAIMIRWKLVSIRLLAGKHAQTLDFIGFLRCNTKFSIFLACGFTLFAVYGKTPPAGFLKKNWTSFFWPMQVLVSGKP